MQTKVKVQTVPYISTAKAGSFTEHLVNATYLQMNFHLSLRLLQAALHPYTNILHVATRHMVAPIWQVMSGNEHTV
jgi:hypothetical protein